MFYVLYLKHNIIIQYIGGTLGGRESFAQLILISGIANFMTNVHKHYDYLK